MKKITTIVVILLFSLTINAQTTLATDSILQLSTCAGDDIMVPFKTTGTYAFSNKFIAQISNAFGQFNNPVDIGNTRFALFGQGIILAQLPPTFSLGIFYKIRVISTNPADTSVSPSNIIITSPPQQLNQILRICQGDSTLLTSTILGASSYSWSTGDSTQSIIARDTGAYSVTTTDALGCTSTVYDTLVGTVICTGIDEESMSNLFDIYPNPSSGTCNLAITNSTSNNLFISIADILGREVLSLSDKNTATEYKKEIDLGDLAPGIYSVQLSIGDDLKTRKLIIQ